MPLSNEPRQDDDAAGEYDMFDSPAIENGVLVHGNGGMANAITGSPMLTDDCIPASQAPMSPMSSFRHECSRIADTHSPLSDAYAANGMPMEVTMYLQNGIRIPFTVSRPNSNTYKDLIQFVDSQVRQHLQDYPNGGQDCVIWYGTADASTGRLTTYDPVLIPGRTDRRLICRMRS